jgi:hypothetical protein
MADLSVLGTGFIIGGVGLVALYVHLRSHAEKFRENSRERQSAVRSRLANDLFLEYLTKSIREINDILKRSPEFAGIRTRLSKAMANNEDISQVLEEVRSTMEKVPPTPDESKRLKELTEGLRSKFEKSEEVSRLYKTGWSAEEKCSGLILRLIVCLIGLGILTLGCSVAATSDIKGGWEPGAILIGGLLVFLVGMASVDAIEKFREARAAQLKFNEMIDDELYSPSTYSIS